MAAKLVIAPETARDIEDAYAWYEGQRPGLGEECLGCVDACIAAICRTPEIHEIVYKEFRRGLVRRFPYPIFYEYVADSVTVYCIFHTAQDPAKWRQRLI
jgi:plasmid stabilization system protein ParE